MSARASVSSICSVNRDESSKSREESISHPLISILFRSINEYFKNNYRVHINKIDVHIWANARQVINDVSCINPLFQKMDEYIKKQHQITPQLTSLRSKLYLFDMFWRLFGRVDHSVYITMLENVCKSYLVTNKIARHNDIIMSIGFRDSHFIDDDNLIIILAIMTKQLMYCVFETDDSIPLSTKERDYRELEQIMDNIIIDNKNIAYREKTTDYFIRLTCLPLKELASNIIRRVNNNSIHIENMFRCQYIRCSEIPELHKYYCIILVPRPRPMTLTEECYLVLNEMQDYIELVAKLRMLNSIRSSQHMFNQSRQVSEHNESVYYDDPVPVAAIQSPVVDITQITTIYTPYLNAYLSTELQELKVIMMNIIKHFIDIIGYHDPEYVRDSLYELHEQIIPLDHVQVVGWFNKTIARIIVLCCERHYLR